MDSWRGEPYWEARRRTSTAEGRRKGRRADERGLSWQVACERDGGEADSVRSRAPASTADAERQHRDVSYAGPTVKSRMAPGPSNTVIGEMAWYFSSDYPESTAYPCRLCRLSLCRVSGSLLDRKHDAAMHAPQVSLEIDSGLAPAGGKSTRRPKANDCRKPSCDPRTAGKKGQGRSTERPTLFGPVAYYILIADDPARSRRNPEQRRFSTQHHF